MPNLTRKAIATAVAIAVSAGTLPAFAAEPVVQGPESVQDWFKQGHHFIRHSEKLSTTTAMPRTSSCSSATAWACRPLPPPASWKAS